ncbi:hypothetical protein NG895_06920 [Aeoliella sp. ICT_H6.2]|uniref:Tetratricopeptide repeat protein n=1 Tax=Aeoliella straminimaris TaxID=2954799 RepID=A0A9X2F7G3_9BACT|nr:tetratricopeptide repeat protein [Aeoliella straminimaris]MCO6043635.1 hypothetical protein [Aeoliella straminimaris]
MPTSRPRQDLIGPAAAALLVTALVAVGIQCLPERVEEPLSPPAPAVDDQRMADRLQPIPRATIKNVAVQSTRVRRLPEPAVVEPAAAEIEPTPLLELLPPIPPEELAGDQGECFEALPDVESVADPEPVVPQEEALAAIETEAPATADRIVEVNPSSGFEAAEFDEDAQLAASTSIDDVLAYFPAANQLSKQFQPRVQQTFTLARHGALHAARAKFEQLLVELAQAKDATQMTSRHTQALAAGLRAIEEADDFLVRDTTKTTPQKIAAGHQTPMLQEEQAERVLPHTAVAMYHLYAQQKLAMAIEGEQAGSMMLFGLGKIYTQLAQRDEQTQAVRKSLTMYRSAVGAHGGNHLAANEAGVLLARAGRYEQAAALLEHAAQLADTSATQRNLAYVMTKLDRPQQAEAHRQAAQQIAQREIARGQLSAERGISWVSPDEFARRTSGGAATVAARPAATAPPRPAPPGAVAPGSDPPSATQRPAHPMWW